MSTRFLVHILIKLYKPTRHFTATTFKGVPILIGVALHGDNHCRNTNTHEVSDIAAPLLPDYRKPPGSGPPQPTGKASQQQGPPHSTTAKRADHKCSPFHVLPANNRVPTGCHSSRDRAVVPLSHVHIPIGPSQM